MTLRVGHQGDEWIPEAKRLADDGIDVATIAKQFNVSVFRVKCATEPGYREMRREQVNASRNGKPREPHHRIPRKKPPNHGSNAMPGNSGAIIVFRLTAAQTKRLDDMRAENGERLTRDQFAQALMVSLLEDDAAAHGRPRLVGGA